MVDAFKADLARDGRQCVLLRQSLWHAEETRRSWFGGYPLRGEGVTWPKHPEHSDMPFLAQIDLAELASTGVALPDGLPENGLLLFFYDLSCTESGLTVLPIVEYWPTDARLVTQRPSAPFRMQDSHDQVFHGAVLNYFHQKGPRLVELDHYPKYAMDMIPSVDLPPPLYESTAEIHRSALSAFCGQVTLEQRI